MFSATLAPTRINPAPGFRNAGGGDLAYIGNEGFSWSSSANETNSAYLRIVPNAVYPCRSDNRGLGLQLRCLSE
ncbi:hypothetical protein [uncultured Rikenella sp.]|uniref:hypothetical protein n=1 Tax=uncultured Rikenella sp. TaxID=368003 RepID=UPI0025DACB48|nr:hypothetical protein [uncultured Rikenella sp.]